VPISAILRKLVKTCPFCFDTIYPMLDDDVVHDADDDDDGTFFCYSNSEYCSFLYFHHCFLFHRNNSKILEDTTK
jgi:hypothetical protein